MERKEGVVRIRKAMEGAPLHALLALAVEQLEAIRDPATSDMPAPREEVRRLAAGILASLTVQIIKRVDAMPLDRLKEPLP
jgi:hypothetical protein